jgi:hypothetical protein
MGMVANIMPYLTIAKWVLGAIGGLAIAWAVYAGIIRPVTKPNPTSSTAQQATTIVNYTIQPRQSFGCTNFRIQKIPDEVKQ